MTNEVIPFNFGSDVPAHLRKASAVAVHNALAAGLPTGSWNKISYRGSRWRLISADGVETLTNTVDLDVIVVRANEHTSKRFYNAAYNANEEGGAPDCYADNGYGPGPRVGSPIATECRLCPNNAWGSKISTNSGKQIKACSDVKRLAVMVFAAPCVDHTGQPTGATLLEGTYELDIPGASLKNLGQCSRDLMANGRTVTMFALRVGFDADAAFPLLTFKPVKWLSVMESEAREAAEDTEAVRLQIGLEEIGAPRSAPPAVPPPLPPAALAAPAPAPLPPPPAPPAPAAAPVPVDPPCPEGIDPDDWAELQARKRAKAGISPAADAPAAPRRGRPPKAVAAASTDTPLLAPSQPPVHPALPGIAPAQAPQSAVIVGGGVTNAQVDAILAGIPGLG